MSDHFFRKDSLHHDIKLLARIKFEDCLAQDLAERDKKNNTESWEIKNIRDLIFYVPIEGALHRSMKWCNICLDFSDFKQKIALIFKRDLRINYTTENSTGFIENILRLSCRDLKNNIIGCVNKLCGNGINFSSVDNKTKHKGDPNKFFCLR